MSTSVICVLQKRNMYYVMLLKNVNQIQLHQKPQNYQIGTIYLVVWLGMVVQMVVRVLDLMGNIVDLIYCVRYNLSHDNLLKKQIYSELT